MTNLSKKRGQDEINADGVFVERREDFDDVHDGEWPGASHALGSYHKQALSTFEFSS